MKSASTLILTLMLAAAIQPDEKYTYAGTGVCAMCHRGQMNHMVYEKWLESKHAVAFKALNPAKGEDRNPACLPCHTTGFGAGGYAIGAPDAAKFEGVQCEACHGPGSAYKVVSIMKDRKQALANGMVIPTEETCKKCHGVKNPMAEKFDFSEALKKIDHRYKSN